MRKVKSILYKCTDPCDHLNEFTDYQHVAQGKIYFFLYQRPRAISHLVYMYSGRISVTCHVVQIRVYTN